MKILIAGTELTVSQCTAYEHANGRRELLISLPQSEIDFATLKGLLDSNDGVIVCTKDDGSTTTYVGYKTSYELTAKTVNEVEVFSIVIKCVAEAERRALEAKQQAEALALLIKQQSEVINAQANVIESLNAQLLETQLAVVDLYEKDLEEAEHLARLEEYYEESLTESYDDGEETEAVEEVVEESEVAE